MSIKKRPNPKKDKILEHLDKFIEYLRKTKQSIKDNTLTEGQYIATISAATIVDALIWEHLGMKKK